MLQCTFPFAPIVVLHSSAGRAYSQLEASKLHSKQIKEEKSGNNKEAHLALFGAIVGATFAAALSKAALLGLS